MKKIVCLTTMMLMTFILFCIPVKAAAELEFELKYSGEVVENKEKQAQVILRGTNATTYSKVRVKVEVTGPGKTKILATDSLGTEIDIVKEGYWGPPTGFAIAGTFENITPIKATFDKPGKYSVKLTLVNMEKGEAEIISKIETIQVSEEKITTNEIEENVVVNNTIEKLPQTGTSITEYIIYAGILLTMIGFGYYRINVAKQ